MNILEEANKITHGERAESYGHPRENFEHTAEILSAILGRKFNARDIGWFNIAQKMAREMHKPKRDNWTNIAGYSWVMHKITFVVIDDKEVIYPPYKDIKFVRVDKQ